MKKKSASCFLFICILIIVSVLGCGYISNDPQAKETIEESIRISKEKAGEMVEKYTGKTKEEIKAEIKEQLDLSGSPEKKGLLSGKEDICLQDIDGNGKDYTFVYDGTVFSAMYTPDNWKIRDSYQITNKADMLIICQALIDEHPVHGSDMVSCRTAEDMVYEWDQHNVVYSFLPEGNRWISDVKNVDFDPEDQGRSFEEMYEDRTGRKLDLKEILRHAGKLKDGGLK